MVDVAEAQGIDVIKGDRETGRQETGDAKKAEPTWIERDWPPRSAINQSKLVYIYVDYLR